MRLQCVNADLLRWLNTFFDHPAGRYNTHDQYGRSASEMRNVCLSKDRAV